MADPIVTEVSDGVAFATINSLASSSVLPDRYRTMRRFLATPMSGMATRPAKSSFFISFSFEWDVCSIWNELANGM